MHRILLEDGAKPVKQPPRRLNSLILDVVIHYTGYGVAAGTLILLLSIGSFLSTLLFHFSSCCFLFVFTVLLLFLILFLFLFDCYNLLFSVAVVSAVCVVCFYFCFCFAVLLMFVFYYFFFSVSVFIFCWVFAFFPLNMNFILKI